MRPAERLCEDCGEAFTPRRRSNARFCGDTCKHRGRRRRQQSKVPRTEPGVRLDPVEERALLLRRNKALRLRRAGYFNGLEALLLVVAPSPDVREASLEGDRA